MKDAIDTTSKMLIQNEQLENVVSSRDDAHIVDAIQQRIEDNFDATLERSLQLEKLIGGYSTKKACNLGRHKKHLNY